MLGRKAMATCEPFVFIRINAIRGARPLSSRIFQSLIPNPGPVEVSSDFNLLGTGVRHDPRFCCCRPAYTRLDELSPAMRKQLDPRIPALINHGVKTNHRSFFVLVGDRGRDQVSCRDVCAGADLIFPGRQPALPAVAGPCVLPTKCSLVLQEGAGIHYVSCRCSDYS